LGDKAFLPINTKKFHPGTLVYGKRGGLCRPKAIVLISNVKANLPDFSEKHSKITLFAIFSARKITLFPKCML
jgi:hypothetical protein